MFKSKCKCLFTFWLIAFVLLCVIVFIAGNVYSYRNALEEIDLPSSVKFILSGVLLVLFCPPLIIIHNHARQENMIRIKRRSLFLFITISVAALGTIITTLFD